MKICLLILILMLTTVSCQTKPLPAAPKTDMEMVQGEWVLARFKTDPTAKGTLSLKPDSTFTGIMDSEKAKAAGKQPKDNTFSGKFALSRRSMDGESILFIDFTITTLSRKPAGSGMGLRLSYDPKNNILADLLMMCYARPSEVNKVKKLLEDSRRAAEVRRGHGK